MSVYIAECNTAQNGGTTEKIICAVQARSKKHALIRVMREYKKTKSDNWEFVQIRFNDIHHIRSEDIY